MRITRKDPFTGKENTLDLPVNEEQLARWRRGELAQIVFSHLDPDQREFLISGIPPGDFAKNLAQPVRRGLFMEHDDGSLSSEASMLDWEPGCWPELIKFEDGQVFEKANTLRQNDGEFGGFNYWPISGEGPTIKIFND